MKQEPVPSVMRRVSFPKPSKSPTFLWILGCLLIQACAGEVAEVPKPTPVEQPAPSEEDKRRALEEEKRRAAAQAERRAVEKEVARRVMEVSEGELLDYALVRVLYATDRRASGIGGKEESADPYGSDRGPLQLGVSAVGIVGDYRRGALDVRPVVKPKPAEEFFPILRDRIVESKQKEALVFVHGYNVTFEEASRRTARLAYDLGFNGVPILYSWPSQGKLAGYLVDETNVEWTVPHLKDFLAQLAARSGAQKIHLVAHSMGARALTSALGQMAQAPPGAALRVNELVLLAPDIDADIFLHLVPEIQKTVERITLYASSRDKALSWSKTMHGYPRAGDTNPVKVVVAGVDTIDASSVDTGFTGHSYYADSRSILFDLFNLLRHGRPPDERFGLLPKEQNGLRYWEFRP
jgi:pimeloyl-ACP methyl ester carboxylesterase